MNNKCKFLLYIKFKYKFEYQSIFRFLYFSTKTSINFMHKLLTFLYGYCIVIFSLHILHSR